MDKLSKDHILIQKANRIIEIHMPEFAKRFFNDKINTLKAGSYYGYALDLKCFFDYALLALIMGAGIKASECVALNIQDVDLKHNIITVESRRGPSQVCISQYLSETLGRYLAERLEMITLYGHDDAFFLSIQKKRISLRSIELLLKKYFSSLFGDEHSINPNEIRSAFKENVFTTSRNIFVTSELTGNAPASLLRQYFPYLEYYEAEKGKDFDPVDLLNRGGTE